MVRGNAETLVLSFLAQQPGHGYRIGKELADRSRQYFPFSFGRLYPLLRGLTRQGHRPLG
jgi:DNA-binding PadR family transcriptional regulator